MASEPVEKSSKDDVNAEIVWAGTRGRCRYSCQVAIFGRRTARQRLRTAAQESLTIPVFSSPDCTPWVIGGVWPAELSTISAETARVADYLRDDLQRIARSANDELNIIRRKGMSVSVGHAEATWVIDQARARAVRRVESTLRHLQTTTMSARTASLPAGRDLAAGDMEKTQVIPAVRDELLAVEMKETQIIPAVRDVQTVNDSTPVTSDRREQPPPEGADVKGQGGAKHRRADD